MAGSSRPSDRRTSPLGLAPYPLHTLARPSRPFARSRVNDLEIDITAPGNGVAHITGQDNAALGGRMIVCRRVAMNQGVTSSCGVPRAWSKLHRTVQSLSVDQTVVPLRSNDPGAAGNRPLIDGILLLWIVQCAAMAGVAHAGQFAFSVWEDVSHRSLGLAVLPITMRLGRGVVTPLESGVRWSSHIFWTAAPPLAVGQKSPSSPIRRDTYFVRAVQITVVESRLHLHDRGEAAGRVAELAQFIHCQGPRQNR